MNFQKKLECLEVVYFWPNQPKNFSNHNLCKCCVLIFFPPLLLYCCVLELSLNVFLTLERRHLKRFACINFQICLLNIRAERSQLVIYRRILGLISTVKCSHGGRGGLGIQSRPSLRLLAENAVLGPVMAGSDATCPRLVLARHYFHVHAVAIGQPSPVHQKKCLHVHRDPVLIYLFPM